MSPQPISNPHNPDLPYFECHRHGLEFFDSAEVRFQYEMLLDTTPERLFEIFEDEKSWTVWAPGIREVIWTTPKPYGVGTKRTVIFQGGMEVYEQFIAWDRGKEMAFIFEGITQPIWWSFGEHYRVEPSASGKVKLTWTVAYNPRHRFAKLSPFLKPAMWLTLRSFTKRLEKYCRQHG